jgi:dTDP-D-glucose 4,6-dehydratase
MIYKANHNQKLPVYGEGINVRDWLYVEDHCKAIDLVYHNGVAGERYNIGGHNEKRNIEIVNEVYGEREDLMQDFVSIISTFCARLYGKKRTKKMTEKLVKKLEEDKDATSGETHSEGE